MTKTFFRVDGGRAEAETANFSPKNFRGAYVCVIPTRKERGWGSIACTGQFEYKLFASCLWKVIYMNKHDILQCPL